MNFPIITNINDVLPRIEGRKEFLVLNKEGYTVIDYLFVDNDSFDDPIRSECRGLIFDEDGNIIRRPFEKFFNYGEKGTYDTLDWTVPHMVMDKRDGSMIAPFLLNGEVRFGTRAGITEHSLRAEEKHLTDIVRSWCEFLFSFGITPIFEWTSPENRIVLPYKEDELRLLALRHMESGEYVSWQSVENQATLMKVKTVDKFDTILSKDSVMNFKETGKDIEGFVVFFPSTGLHIKIKTDEYTNMHRAVSFIERENMVLPVILEGTYDDILPALREEDQKRLKDYASYVNEAVYNLTDTVNYVLDNTLKHMETRKEQALYIQQHISRSMWAVYFGALDGKEVVDLIKNTMLKLPEELLSIRWKDI